MLRKTRLFIILAFFSCWVYAQDTLYNNGAYIFINSDTLFINGTLIQKSNSVDLEDFNIHIGGTIIIKDSLYSTATKLFRTSTDAIKGVETDNWHPDSLKQEAVYADSLSPLGEVIFNGKKIQAITGDSMIYFNDIRVENDILLKNNQYVMGEIYLDTSDVLLDSFYIQLYDIPDVQEGYQFRGTLVNENENGRVFGEKGLVKAYKDINLKDSIENIGGLGIKFNKSLGYTRIIRGNMRHENITDTSIARYFDIKPSMISDPVKIDIYYFDTEFDTNHVDEEHFKMWYSKDAGANFKKIGSTVYMDDNYVTNDIEKFSDWNTNSHTRFTVADEKCENLFGLSLGNDTMTCVQTPLTLVPTITGDPPGEQYDYYWNDEADPSTSTLTLDYQTNEYRVDTFTLWVVNSRGCENWDTVVVEINPLPVVKFGKRDACHKDYVEFSDSSTLSRGTITNWDWDFGDGTTSTEQNPVKTYLVPDTFNVVLTCTTDKGCQASYNRPDVKMYPLPVAEFDWRVTTSNDYSLVWLEDKSRLDWTVFKNYYWFVDNNTIEGSSRQYPVDTLGNYDVTHVVVTSANCSDTITKTVVVGLPGKAEFLVENSCAGTPVSIKNLSEVNQGAPSYNWQFGDGTGDTVSRVPQKIYNQPGTYTITLTVMNQYGWTESDSKQITIYPASTSEFGDTIATCNPFYELEAPADGQTYIWSDNSTGPTMTVNSDGIYWLQAVGEKGCGKEFVHVDVNAEVIPRLGGDRVVCGSLVLDAHNPGSQYTWSTGDVSRTIEVKESGIYTVDVTDKYGCAASETVDITVKEYYQLELGNDTTFCSGEILTLVAGPPGQDLQFQWNGLSANHTLDVATTGQYKVTVTASNGCVSKDSIYLYVKRTPKPNLGMDKVFCSQATSLLEANLPYDDCRWYSSNGDTLRGQFFTVSDTGTYWLSATSSEGCTGVDTAWFEPAAYTITPLFLSPTHAKVGDTVYFSEMSFPPPILSFGWEFGDGFTAWDKNPVHIYQYEDTFDISLTVNNGECDARLQKQIIVQGYTKSWYGQKELPPIKEEAPSLYVGFVNSKLYPNPNSGQFTLELSLTKKAETKIYLYSITGHLIDIQKLSGSEEYMLEYNMQYLKNGIYILKAIAGNDAETYKIVIGN